MLNFKSDCYCCGQIRRHPKPRWHNCLNFKKPSCPKMNTLTHNVLAPSNAQHSKAMRNVQYLKVAAPGRGRWRKVCWKRFKLQQRTAEYQTRIITNSTNTKCNSQIVVRNGQISKNACSIINPKSVKELHIKPNCKNNLQLSWDTISQLSPKEIDNYYYEDNDPPITCGKYYTPPPTDERKTTIDFVNGQYCNRMQQWETR